MSLCQKCGSPRIASISGKSSDCNSFTVCPSTPERRPFRSAGNGYVPKDMGIGGGDYIELDWCLDCGQLQGEWPLETTEMEQMPEEE